MQRSLVMGLALLALVVSGCSNKPPIVPGQEAAEPTDTGSNLQYRLGTGDALRITVFGEPELSGEFVVDGVGQVSIPLLGQVDADGYTVPELEQLVKAALLQKNILRDPQVSAEVTNYRPYYILGEVNDPGQYSYTNGLTVMNAIATAGGFTYRANRKRIFVTHADATDEEGYRLTPETKVLPGDTIRITQCIIC